MCVGDSMTIGRAGDFTWRYRMWQHLSMTFDGPFALVGPRTELYDAETGTASSSAYAADFPPAARRHLAGWGEGWLHMAPVIADTVTAHRPDVLLVSLGLIDLGFYTDSAQTAENARAFLTAAREANPHIRCVLLPVIPNIRAETDAPFAAECTRFNELLAKAVADLDTSTSPSSLPPTPPRTTSTPTHTTAPTRAPRANTTWPPPSRTRCTRRGGWAGRTRGWRPQRLSGEQLWSVLSVSRRGCGSPTVRSCPQGADRSPGNQYRCRLRCWSRSGRNVRWHRRTGLRHPRRRSGWRPRRHACPSRCR